MPDLPPKAAEFLARFGTEGDNTDVTLDFGDLEGVGGVDSWQFCGVLDVGNEVGTDLALRYIPNG